MRKDEWTSIIRLSERIQTKKDKRVGRGSKLKKYFLVQVNLWKGVLISSSPAVEQRWAWSGCFYRSKQRHFSLCLPGKQGSQMGHCVLSFKSLSCVWLFGDPQWTVAYQVSLSMGLSKWIFRWVSFPSPEDWCDQNHASNTCLLCLTCIGRQIPYWATQEAPIMYHLSLQAKSL